MNKINDLNKNKEKRQSLPIRVDVVPDDAL